jgi:hypothetical protein
VTKRVGFFFPSRCYEAMSLVQLFVPADVAHVTVAELSELGNVEFKGVSSCLSLSLAPLTHIPDSAAQSQCEPLPTFFFRRNPAHRRDGTPGALLRNPD